MKKLSLIFIILLGVFCFGVQAGRAQATTGQLMLLSHSVGVYASSNEDLATATLNTTGASMVAVCYTASTAGAVANPITDSLGNTWQLANTTHEDGDIISSLWYSIGPLTGANDTFSAGGYWPSLSVMAFSGVASGPDQQNSSEGYGSPFTAGNVTPTDANELVVSCASAYDTSAPTIAAPLTIVDSNSQGEEIASAYQVQITATTVNPTWSDSNASGLATVADTFYSSLSPAPLSIKTTSLSEGFGGTAYNMQLVVNGGVGPFTWALTSGSLPIGLTLSSGGLISGMPTQAILQTPLVFQVKDSKGNIATTSVMPLTIASSAPSITTQSCPGGTQYAAYSGCTLAGSGGTAPYTFSWNATNGGAYAALPEGLNLNASTGAITGTVYGQGTYGVQFIATDAAGATATQNISFAIAGDSTLGGCSLFPGNSIFHTNISDLPVDTSPAAAIPSVYQSATIKPFFGSGANGNYPNGIPFIRVPWNEPYSTITDTLGQPYFTSGPISPYAPPEGTSNSNGDRHVLVLQTAGGGNPCKLWEMYQGVNTGTSTWSAGGAVDWPDLTSYALTPLGGVDGTGDGTTDAAGLPILPLTVNYDEVASGVVTHPIRFTLNHMLHYYVWPATTGYAGVGSCTGVPLSNELSQSSPPSACSFSGPAGEIYRLKANVATPSACSGDPQSLTIIQAFRNYGIILADNGISGGLIGTPDARWSDSQLSCLKNLTLSDFEPVNVSSLMVDPDSAATLSSASSIPPITNIPPPLNNETTSTIIITTTPTTTTTTAPNFFTKNLAPGSTGTDVTALQDFLVKDGDYPQAIITGYYGSLTEAAVKTFQSKYGIVNYGSPSTTGYGTVGPKTRGKMNEII